MIKFLVFIQMFCTASALAQVCIDDVSTLPEIMVDSIHASCIEIKPGQQQDLIQTTEALRQHYFELIENTLTEKDSIEIWNSFQAMGKDLKKIEDKNLREIARRLSHSSSVVYAPVNPGQCPYEVRMCFHVEVEKSNPIGFVIAGEYKVTHL